MIEFQVHTIFRVVVVRYVEKLPTWPNIVRIKGNKIWYPPEMMVSGSKNYLMYLCIMRIVFLHIIKIWRMNQHMQCSC